MCWGRVHGTENCSFLLHSWTSALLTTCWIWLGSIAADADNTPFYRRNLRNDHRNTSFFQQKPLLTRGGVPSKSTCRIIRRHWLEIGALLESWQVSFRLRGSSLAEMIAQLVIQDLPPALTITTDRENHSFPDLPRLLTWNQAYMMTSLLKHTLDLTTPLLSFILYPSHVEAVLQLDHLRAVCVLPGVHSWISSSHIKNLT